MNGPGTNNEIGYWLWDRFLNECCLVVEHLNAWSVESIRVWYPSTNATICVSSDRLVPLDQAPLRYPALLRFTTAAAKIIDTLSENQVIAPISSAVLPLPHQLRILSKATRDGRFRLLLADEVGLGKTIEAGLMMRELKLRGLVRRVLVVAPKGLVIQWVAEMKTRFNEEFRLILPNEASNRIQHSAGNMWMEFDNVVCPMDSVKPIEFRRGWTNEEIAEYNRLRYQNLISAEWDLVIIDEAHRLGGSNDVIARYKLGRALAQSAPYLLLLSATPHQGKTEAFHRLIQLLDEEYFPDIESISRDRLSPYVIRTEKRQAVDPDGKPLFKPRYAQLFPIAWEERHRNQHILYESVSEYVREGYNKAIQERKTYLAFLMLLMQRLVTSSTRAILSTLERRAEVLAIPNGQLDLGADLSPEEWTELDGQSQVELVLSSWNVAHEDETKTIESLIQLAQQSHQIGPDAKAEALLSLIYRLQQEENDPILKILIFTEFVPTQHMLDEFLTARGFKAVCLNGSMSLEERIEAQKSFAGEGQILISTDAGGEGINLQFCHIVINYDLPWNPMRIEQRIGRVDRIGQSRTVRAFNFVLQDTVEFRVREVLEDKLGIILADLGIDKASDVLDYSLSNAMFDELYISAVQDESNIEKKVQSIMNVVKEESSNSTQAHEFFTVDEAIDTTEAKRLRAHPLPHWIERMVTSFIEYKGGHAEKSKDRWTLHWPDGIEMENVVFGNDESFAGRENSTLSLQDSRLQQILNSMPRFLNGQRALSLLLLDIGSDISGLWSLWEIGLSSSQWRKTRYIPLFRHNDGRFLQPTAQAIWNQLLVSQIDEGNSVPCNISAEAFALHRAEAEIRGQSTHALLEAEYSSFLDRERSKRLYLFESKRKSIMSVGLEGVRSHRLNQLAYEQRKSDEVFLNAKAAVPSLQPVAFVLVRGGGKH